MDEFKVGDEVEVCERFTYRAAKPTDSVMWRGVVARETPTQWVVTPSSSLGSGSRFRKATGEEIGISGGFVRYLRRRQNPTAAPAPQP
jgi:hypothetical protein